MQIRGDVSGIDELLGAICGVLRGFMDDQGIDIPSADFSAAEGQIDPLARINEWLDHTIAILITRAVLDAAQERGAVRIRLAHRIDGPGLHYVIGFHRGQWAAFRDYSGPRWSLEGTRDRIADWLIGYLVDALSIDIDAGPHLS